MIACSLINNIAVAKPVQKICSYDVQIFLCSYIAKKSNSKEMNHDYLTDCIVNCWAGLATQLVVRHMAIPDATAVKCIIQA